MLIGIKSLINIRMKCMPACLAYKNTVGNGSCPADQSVKGLLPSNNLGTMFGNCIMYLNMYAAAIYIYQSK